MARGRACQAQGSGGVILDTARSEQKVHLVIFLVFLF